MKNVRKRSFFKCFFAILSILWAGLPELKDNENRAPKVVRTRSVFDDQISCLCVGFWDFPITGPIKKRRLLQPFLKSYNRMRIHLPSSFELKDNENRAHKCQFWKHRNTNFSNKHITRPIKHHRPEPKDNGKWRAPGACWYHCHLSKKTMLNGGGQGACRYSG